MNITSHIPVGALQILLAPTDLNSMTDSVLRAHAATLIDEALQCVPLQRLEGPQAVLKSASPTDNRRLCTYLKQHTAAQVGGLSQRTGEPASAVIKRLLIEMAHMVSIGEYTRAPEIDPDHPVVTLISALQAKGSSRTVVPEQIKAHDYILSCLDTRVIGMVEASTGTGKTAAYVLAASQWALANNKPVCIAAPTLALLRQVHEEINTQSAVRDTPPMRLYAGRSEFVSQLLLQEWLDARVSPAEDTAPATKSKPCADDTLDAALKWAALGGYNPERDASPWLVESLRSACPEFPVSEVTLPLLADPQDWGYKAYKAQFEQAGKEIGAHILVCTHAMLGQDMRQKLRAAGRDPQYQEVMADLYELLKSLAHTPRGKGQAKAAVDDIQKAQAQAYVDAIDGDGLLPLYQALIVDEAHTLEQSFANTFSEYLAVRKIISSLRTYKTHGGKISSADIDRVNQQIALISKDTPRDETHRLDSNKCASAKAALTHLYLTLSELTPQKIPKKSAPEKLQAIFELKRAIGILKMATGSASSRSHIRFSPTRAYPQLFVGRDRVDNILALMWNSVESGAAVSATLYLDRYDGPSAAYQRSLLAIPEERAREFPPIKATWLKDAIESVNVVSQEDALKLTPPSRNDALNEAEAKTITSAWLDALSEEMKHIVATAKGGTLVLNTSYETVAGLQARLAEHLPHIVYAQEGKPLQSQAKDFLQLSALGKKPLWLAVGGAWTGLDIGGHEPLTRLLNLEQIPAQDDVILTDLVIPRMPFGTNNSITHLRRVAQSGSRLWDILDAAFVFKQGLGRLVRRKGLPKNRRIWVLDGRLRAPNARQNYAPFWAACEHAGAAPNTTT
jgi:CRISPR type IV-associated DEAD/DEAH-box helicase Csf4